MRSRQPTRRGPWTAGTAANYDVYDCASRRRRHRRAGEQHVYCEYYRCRAIRTPGGHRPAHLRRQVRRVQAICHYLATRASMASCSRWLLRPRRPKEPDRMRALTQNSTPCARVPAVGDGCRRAAAGWRPTANRPRANQHPGTSLGASWPASPAGGRTVCPLDLRSGRRGSHEGVDHTDPGSTHRARSDRGERTDSGQVAGSSNSSSRAPSQAGSTRQRADGEHPG